MRIWGQHLAKNDCSSAKELPALQEGRKPHMAQLQCPPPCVLAGMEPPKDPPHSHRRRQLWGL